MTDDKGQFAKRLEEVRAAHGQVPILWNHDPAAVLPPMTKEQFDTAMRNVMAAFEYRGEE
jgi:hypothetical protein